MTIKQNLWLLICLLSIATASAQEVVSIEMTIHKNDTATLNEALVVDGQASYYQWESDYEIQLLDESASVIYQSPVGVTFLIMSNPPVPTDQIELLHKAPFNDSMRTVRLLKHNQSIFEQELQLCNKNGICDSYETYLSCPDDCPLDEQDGVCLNDHEGICDPDCAQGVDPDCKLIMAEEPKRNETTTPATQQENQPFNPFPWIIALLVIIIIVIAILFIHGKKPGKPSKQNDYTDIMNRLNKIQK